MAIITLNNNSLVNADVGKIAQVIYEEDTTNNMITTSTSSVDVVFGGTVFTATITPSSTSSKILCMGILPMRSSHNGGNEAKYGMSVHAKIGAGSYTKIYGKTADATYFGGYDYGGSGLQVGISVPINVLYSPNTTSVVTFKYQVLTRDASSDLTVNRGQVGTSFTLMEVLA